jgi:hypothetical protein
MGTMLNRWNEVVIGLGLMAVLEVTLSGAATTGSGGQPVDLTRFYDAVDSGFDKPGVWEEVPRGAQQLGRVAFQIEGIIQLAGTEAARYGKRYRDRVDGIPVPVKVHALYLLHGTAYGGVDGQAIAQIVFHYDDGTTAETPIVYGRHVRDWWRATNEQVRVELAPGSRVAWTGTHPDSARWGGKTLRLYLSEFANPKPKKPVQSIDLVSTHSPATPVILAITAGSAPISVRRVSGAERGASPSPAARADRRLNLRVVDRQTGRPLPQATVTVDLRDEGGFLALGSHFTGRRGTVILRYPDDPERYLSLRVVKTGYVPMTVDWREEAGEPVPEEFELGLEAGLTVGGRVLDDRGEPLANARIELVPAGVAEVGDAVRVEWGHGLFVASTDEHGGWSRDGVAPPLDQVRIRASHPDHRDTTFTVISDGVTGPRVLKANELMAQRAVLRLQRKSPN